VLDLHAPQAFSPGALATSLEWRTEWDAVCAAPDTDGHLSVLKHLAYGDEGWGGALDAARAGAAAAASRSRNAHMHMGGVRRHDAFRVHSCPSGVVLYRRRAIEMCRDLAVGARATDEEDDEFAFVFARLRSAAERDGSDGPTISGGGGEHVRGVINELEWSEAEASVRVPTLELSPTKPATLESVRRNRHPLRCCEVVIVVAQSRLSIARALRPLLFRVAITFVSVLLAILAAAVIAMVTAMATGLTASRVCICCLSWACTSSHYMRTSPTCFCPS